MKSGTTHPAHQRLAGLHLAVTGPLSAISLEESITLIRRLGGTYDRSVGASTDYLVVGEMGWPLRSDGRLSHQLERARQSSSNSHGVTILSEQDFLRAVGDRSLGTQARIEPKQLFSQTLGLAPETIDRWVAGGVVKPFKSVNGLQHFAVHTIDTAYALSRALELGVPVARMRRSLHQLRSCWRPMTRVLSQLEILAAQAQSQEQDQDRRRPSARPRLLEERTLSPRRLSSSTSGPMTNTGGDMESEVPKCLDDWLRQGALSGSIGDHLSAADAYQEALLMGGPKPDITYELAKALQRAGRSSEAAQRFLQTVELDPGYYKAWHRLGVCLLTSGQVEDAIPAFRKAINACPGYAEPHGFLAECLDVAQRDSEATPHWRLFIDLAPHNPLAQHATERIEACRPGSAAES